MNVEHITVGMFMENCFLVFSGEDRDGVILDPGDEAERIIDLVTAHGVTPRMILNTHAHIDHVGAVADLKRHYEIPFLLHPGERENLADMRSHAAMFGIAPPECPEVDEWIEDGQVFPVGEGSLRAVETPGHTPGGVSFVADGFVIAGDTLFAGSVGRTDLPGGDTATLKRSIREKLFALPPETVVHCGHGPSTTIDQERRSNPFVGDNPSPFAFG